MAMLEVKSETIKVQNNLAKVKVTSNYISQIQGSKRRRKEVQVGRFFNSK